MQCGRYPADTDRLKGEQMKYIVANWKSQKTTADGRIWLEQFAALHRGDGGTRVILAPTLVSLEGLAESAKKLKLKNLFFAAQDISPFPRGSYTGAVAADLVQGVAQYAIIGHAERRRYFHESSQDILNKAGEAVDAGLIPLVCVEEAAQLVELTALAELDGEIFFAYTPHDPVVSGAAEPVEKVEEMAKRMQRALPQATILYGGAVTPQNSGTLLAAAGIDGLCVGQASLDAATFVAICNLC